MLINNPFQYIVWQWKLEFNWQFYGSSALPRPSAYLSVLPFEWVFSAFLIAQLVGLFFSSARFVGWFRLALPRLRLCGMQALMSFPPYSAHSKSFWEYIHLHLSPSKNIYFFMAVPLLHKKLIDFNSSPISLNTRNHTILVVVEHLYIQF